MADKFEKKVDEILKGAKEGFEHIKDSGKKLLVDISGVWTAFALWLQTLSGSAMVAWLFAIGFGIALLPGIGFFVGVLIGTQLTEAQKQDLVKIVADGPKWIQDIVAKLGEQIQSKWSDFTTHFSKDLNSWENKEDEIKKAASDISKQLNSDEAEEETKQD